MNIFKVIKNLMPNFRIGSKGLTTVNIMEDKITIDRKINGQNVEIASIPFEQEYTSRDERVPEDSDDAEFHCVGAAVVNMANIFGGVYATAFVVNGDENGENKSIIKNIFDILSDIETQNNLLTKRMCSDTGGTLKINSEQESGIGCAMDVSHFCNGSAYIIAYQLPAEKFNNMIPEDESDYNLIATNIKEDISKVLSPKNINIRAPKRAIDAAIHGLIASIDCGYDGTLVNKEDRHIINKTNVVPDVCRYGEDGELAESFCRGLLDYELILIGTNIKKLCRLDYIPEIQDCHWADVVYITKLLEKYAKAFTSNKFCRNHTKLILLYTYCGDYSYIGELKDDE